MPIRLATVFTALILMTLTPPAYAQQKEGLRLPRGKMDARSIKPPRPRAADPCMQYGPGFARIDGTETCIKIGGSIGIGGGINSNTLSR